MAVFETQFVPLSRRSVTNRARWRAPLGVAMGLMVLAGCSRKPAPSESQGGETEQAKSAETQSPEPVPLIPPEKVKEVVNPKGNAPYAGPTGSLQGRVVATGDRPPAVETSLKQIPANCAQARETFGHLFREGMDRSLADVLVAVTEYDGYVPATADAVTVEAQGCAWKTRTVVLTYGQRIDVVSKDEGTYVPELLGQSSPVQLFATPGGQPIQLTPRGTGRYVLVDSMRLFNTADVYVLPYSTFAVTGLEGTFKIDRIPPGKVKVNALLPMTGVTVEKEVTVEAGQTVTVDLEIPFDLKVHEQKAKVDLKAQEQKAKGT